MSTQTVTGAGQRRPANWYPVLVSLIQKHRVIHAIKLWGVVCRYRNEDGMIDLARAHADIEAIRSHRKPMPDGTEHPDIDSVELAYYAGQPWQQR